MNRFPTRRQTDKRVSAGLIVVAAFLLSASLSCGSEVEEKRCIRMTFHYEGDLPTDNYGMLYFRMLSDAGRWAESHSFLSFDELLSGRAGIESCSVPWSSDADDPPVPAVATAWIDMDASKYEACRESLFSEHCVPGPNDPQHTEEFIYPKAGERVRLHMVLTVPDE